MELKLISKDARTIKIEIIDGMESVLTPLQQKLLEDDKVETATLTRHHRALDNPVLYVKVKDGKPQTAVKRATKALANEVKDFSQLFETEL
jgi:DNA-directed RNA polymerase subunit L